MLIRTSITLLLISMKVKINDYLILPAVILSFLSSLVNFTIEQSFKQLVLSTTPFEIGALRFLL
jgi:hypothetical protein